MLGDDRGQSVQIGAILLFGILIIALSLFQTVVVPAENEGVEFNGYLEASEDLVSFRNDILTAGTQGGQQATSIKTGVRYPARAVLINPGPPAGSLTTRPPANVTISGVEAASGEAANVRDFWNTSARGARTYTTRSVVFEPAYNEIEVSPVEVSGEGAYRLTGNGPVPLTSGTFVRGNRITLVTVEGNLSTTALTASAGASPASVATRSVTITGRDGAFTVTLPVPGNGTVAAAQAWNRSSAAATLRANANVQGTAVNGTRVDVTFDGSTTYDLRLARVVVHDAGNSGVDTDTAPAYLVGRTPNGTTIAESGGAVAVEVRDRYNNPVSGASVRFSTPNGTGAFPADGDGLDNETTVRTDGQGQATVNFDIDDGVDTTTVEANLTTGDDPWTNTTLTLVRAGSGGGGGGSTINPNAIDGLVLQDATIDDDACSTGGGPGGGGPPGGSNPPDCQVQFTLENLDDGDGKTITEVRYAFYSVDRRSDSTRDAPPQVELRGEGVTLQVRGQFTTIDRQIAAGGSTTFDARFEQSNGQPYDEVKQGDFFVVTALVDLNGDGTADESSNYFVAPEN